MRAWAAMSSFVLASNTPVRARPYAPSAQQIIAGFQTWKAPKYPKRMNNGRILAVASAPCPAQMPTWSRCVCWIRSIIREYASSHEIGSVVKPAFRRIEQVLKPLTQRRRESLNP